MRMLKRIGWPIWQFSESVLSKISFDQFLKKWIVKGAASLLNLTLRGQFVPYDL